MLISLHSALATCPSRIVAKDVATIRAVVARNAAGPLSAGALGLTLAAI